MRDLKVELKLRLDIEIAAKPQGRVGGHIAALANDFSDPVGRYADRLGDRF